MKSKNNIFLIVLSVVLGGIFLFSAYSKTIPSLAYFEQTINDQLNLSPTLSAIAARFFIGLEAALGLLLITVLYGKRKWILKAALALLVVFSVHLLLLWIRMGDDVDCGCMGTLMPMSPSLSLLKNLGMIIILIILIKFYKGKKEKNQDLLAALVLWVFVVAPFFLFPIRATNYGPISLTPLYEDAHYAAPSMEIREGKNVLCFMSLTCSHCKDAATEINKIHADNSELPFYFIFQGLGDDNDSLETAYLNGFLRESNHTTVPYTIVDRKKFIDILQSAGETGVPAIFWMEDTTIVRKISIPEINQKSVETWLQQ